jgi:hypothetical protein
MLYHSKNYRENACYIIAKITENACYIIAKITERKHVIS